MLSFGTAGVKRLSASATRPSATTPFLGTLWPFCHLLFALAGGVLHIRRHLLLVPARMNFFLITSDVLRRRLAGVGGKIHRSKRLKLKVGKLRY
jgi:hypothetical protein